MKKCFLSLVKKCILFLCALASFGLLHQTAFAETLGSITVNFKCSGKPLENMVSYAYKVADVTDGRFTFVSTFAGAGITDEQINILTESDLSDEAKVESAQKAYAEYAQTLYEYAVTNSITQTATAISNSSGVASYTGLEIGVYLIYSEPLRVGTFTYVAAPILIAIPSWDAINGSYVYDCTVNAKCEEIEDNIDYSVRKVWKDSGYESNRPSSITAKIYLDGAEYQTITLSSANNWSYSWSYEPGHTFSVREVSTASNYTASVTQSGYVFTITNTYTPPSTPDTPDEPETPTPTDEETPPEPEEPTTPVEEVLGVIRKLEDVPSVLGARRLPQTGLLIWPIPILLAAGILMMVLGVRSLKKSSR